MHPQYHDLDFILIDTMKQLVTVITSISRSIHIIILI